MNILIVATSHTQLGDTGRKTGLWLEELAFPYYIFKDAGADDGPGQSAGRTGAAGSQE
jgi:hypothetical protein